MLSNADKKWMNETTSEENVSDLKRPTTAHWSINYVGSSASAVAPTASSVIFFLNYMFYNQSLKKKLIFIAAELELAAGIKNAD